MLGFSHQSLAGKINTAAKSAKGSQLKRMLQQSECQRPPLASVNHFHAVIRAWWVLEPRLVLTAHIYT